MDKSILDQYEVVVGLEVHAQLLTKTKAFSDDINEYGSLPNSNTSAISLGHPGTLPVLNEKSVEYAIKLGLAVDADIREHNEFARKNYFYADLPKGYQITQDTTPICNGGFIQIKTDQGEKKVGLTRIHMEEDSGKSIHDLSPFDTMIDLNRAGVPLLEIVSEPDMRSGDEAYAYLTEVRKLVRYLEICDGNMEEGSLRCDANVSVRKKGTEAFGTRVEVKNLNSIRNVKRAIDHEFVRHVEMIEKGERITKSTLTFDAVTGKTSVMRTKEEADDYRYFPEPDLPPLTVTSEDIERYRAELPPLPQALQLKYVSELNLSEYDAAVLTDEKHMALYFEDVIAHTAHYKSAANWLMGEVKAHLNEQAKDIRSFEVQPERLAELVNLVEDGKIGRTLAAQQVFPLMLKQPNDSVQSICEQHDLIQVMDQDELSGWVQAALDKFPAKVEEYRNGKKGILGLFMGEVMRMSGGKADPKLTNEMIRKALEN